MKPAGHTAVMASTAGLAREGDDARTALYRRLEYFPTPIWAARAGGELINAIDPPGADGAWLCWEPACGEGHMAHGLRDYFHRVHCSDIHLHETGLQHGDPLDFLSPAADLVVGADWIVTNPPFGLAAEFVRAGLRRARRGVAILARSAFFESASRFHLFFPPERGPDAGGARLLAFAPFFERVPMTLGRWDPKASTATAYAWFVWMTPAAAADMAIGARRLVALRPEVWPIGPGTRARLTRPEDARTWGAAGDAPLFDQIDGEG